MIVTNAQLRKTYTYDASLAIAAHVARHCRSDGKVPSSFVLEQTLSDGRELVITLAGCRMPEARRSKKPTLDDLVTGGDRGARLSILLKPVREDQFGYVGEEQLSVPATFEIGNVYVKPSREEDHYVCVPIVARIPEYFSIQCGTIHSFEPLKEDELFLVRKDGMQSSDASGAKADIAAYFHGPILYGPALRVMLQYHQVKEHVLGVLQAPKALQVQKVA